MYYVKKTLEISAAHRLQLDYESKCNNLHGHNWVITIYCKSKELDRNGMVVDFTHIKKLVKGQLDHKLLNDVIPCQPTAENIARWLTEQIPNCYRADVQESEGNMASYEVDE
ncbi:MAG: 6-carboxytetrahydropterin synthase QueD [Prevotella sp.]|nr:6-carboxytetrahydropterin synthase QueD [Prevotella sp.]